MTHHYYISYFCGNNLGAIGVTVRNPLNTVPLIYDAAEGIRNDLSRQAGKQMPRVVILNVMPCEPAGPIIEVPASAALKENGGRP
jgi:hypothetical protein